MNRSKTLSLFFLCFTISLAGCSKSDPPKQITQDTCSQDYLRNHPDLAKALYEAEGSPSKAETFPAGTMYFGHRITEIEAESEAAHNIMEAGLFRKSLPLFPYQKEALDYLNKHGPEKYKKYVADCRKLAGLNNPFNTETKK